MKRIHKNREPRSLMEYRKKTNATYENYRAKNDLRKSLLEEQGYLCCYCMQRVQLDKMKIEHWRSQSNYPALQLDYKNLLGACLGKEGARPKNQHCDTRKGDTDITINPTDLVKNCESLIKYSSTGEILSDDSSINHDLNDTLNLNLEFLKTNRKKALNTVIQQLNQKFPARTWSKDAIQEFIDKLNSKNAEGYYSEYCGYVIWYLRKRVRTKKT